MENRSIPSDSLEQSGSHASAEEALRRQVLQLLAGKGAHADFDTAVAGWPEELRGRRPGGLPHSAWELVEHLRIALWDLVEYSRGPGHGSPPWPEGYWPAEPAPPDAAAWEGSLKAYRRHLDEMSGLVADPERDLLAPFAWGQGANLLREAHLAADHAAYHLGQLVLVRRLLGAWPPASAAEA